MKEKLKNLISKGIRKKNKLRFGCFIEGCPETAINSHSQSLSNALKKISKNGHVVSAKLRYFRSADDIKSCFQRIGVSCASTFIGFRAEHDNRYFRSADNIDQQNTTKESLARLAFRTFAYEERTKEQTLFFCDYVISNADNQCDLSYLQSYAVGVANHLKVTRPYYLDRFISMLESQDYDQVNGLVFILNRMIPISCSTVIDPTMIDSDDLMKDDLQKPLNQVFFNLIPQTNSSLVVFAYFKEQEVMLQEFIRKLTSLENIVFNHCEEVLMSPDFYDSLSSELKCKIIKGLRCWAFWEREHFPDLFNVKLESPIYI